jgi:hypothetical protein
MRHNREEYASNGADYGERSDCAVKALACAASMPYGKAHALFAKHGRLPGRPTKSYVSWLVYKELGLTALRPIERTTLSQFCRMHPTGRYTVYISGHVLAVKDGVVNDWWPKPRRIVKAFYCVDSIVTDGMPPVGVWHDEALVS